MRPIMLTAAAATLALIPIAHEIFWGPMAYAMMGGIVVGTALTLLFCRRSMLPGSGSSSPIKLRVQNSRNYLRGPIPPWRSVY